MFESTLGAHSISWRNLSTGAVLSIGAHVVVVAAVIGFLRHPSQKKAPLPEVTFSFYAPSPPPPPPPPLGGAASPNAAQKKPEPVRHDTFVPKVPDQPKKPVEAALDEGAKGASKEGANEKNGVKDGDPNGVEGGVIGGVVGGSTIGCLGGTGVPGNVPPPPVSNVVLPFGEGMTRPVLLDGPEVTYPREAREAKVEGSVLAKCVITTAGALRSCRILKGLPFLDQPVLDALTRRRYSPVTYQGRLVEVEYVIPFRFTLGS